MVGITLFFLMTISVTLISVWLKNKFTYWKKKNVSTLSLSLYLNHFKMGILQRHSQADRDLYLYKNFKAQNVIHGGTYFYFRPVYMPIDLGIIKHILQIDHQYFSDRGMYVNEKGDPLSANLFSLGGNRWRTLRRKLTPTFTSGKMRMMFQTILDCTVDLRRVMTNNHYSDVDVKDVMARFTTDVIGSVAFGVQCNSLENPNCEFMEKGRRLFRTNFCHGLKHGALYAFPEFMQLFNLKMVDPEASDFFMNVTRDTVNYRERNDIFRSDFMHLLIQLKNRSKLVHDENANLDGKDMDESITLAEIAAQAFIFFEAGYESSSNTASFCLYELALNAHIQDRVRKEICQVLERYDGILTYDAVEEMKYLDQVLCETLRKYPPLSTLYRVCTQTYRIPDTDIILEKGTRVSIPAYGIHHDPQYYPDPEKFDPDRFRNTSRPDCSFMPFGMGPRICIGLRFGKLQTKMGLISLLENFEFMPTEKTPVPLKLDPESYTLAAKGNLWLKHRTIVNGSEAQIKRDSV